MAILPPFPAPHTRPPFASTTNVNLNVSRPLFIRSGAAPTTRLPPCLDPSASRMDVDSPAAYKQYHSHPQFHTVQIIELVECPAPPPRKRSPNSVPTCWSSSYDGSSSSSAQSDEASTSYCSSDEGDASQSSKNPSDSSHSVSMGRIRAWRDKYVVTPTSEHRLPISSSRPKRKAGENGVEDEDDISHPPNAKRQRFCLCTACDRAFSTEESLRRHGQTSSAHEACRAAVAYSFES